MHSAVNIYRLQVVFQPLGCPTGNGSEKDSTRNLVTHESTIQKIPQTQVISEPDQSKTFEGLVMVLVKLQSEKAADLYKVLILVLLFAYIWIFNGLTYQHQKYKREQPT